jgi:hypothetical protein
MGFLGRRLIGVAGFIFGRARTLGRVNDMKGSGPCRAIAGVASVCLVNFVDAHLA